SLEISSELKGIVEELKNRGYRMTPQRILLTKMILETVEKHPTLKELHEESQEILPGTGVSTVYNTIMMLDSLGVIRVFYLDGKLYIDRARPHVNIVCREPVVIRDLDGGALEEIKGVLEKRNIKLEDMLVIIMGECKDGGS
ncbi:MAG: Fur family transcriptional regulator, partial [Acidilobaceae archaeon]